MYMYLYIYIYITWRLASLRLKSWPCGGAAKPTARLHKCARIARYVRPGPPMRRFATQSRVSVRICSMARLTYAVHRPSATSALILAASLRDAGKIHPEGMLELG